MPYCWTVAVQSATPATASSMALQAASILEEESSSLSLTLILYLP